MSINYQLILLVVVLCLNLTFAALTKQRSSKECLNEKHRPQLHFSPKAHWINDPNGMVYYDGEYHLQYQYNPDDVQWGPMHWGHAVSRDLVTWTELPITLYPDELGAIFSGSATIDLKNATGFQNDPNVQTMVAMFTHAGSSQQQSIAYSNDKGRTFTKFEGNPVIPNPGIPDFRDPKVVQYDANTWVVVIASGDRVKFYKTNDLKRWELSGEFGAEPSQGSHGGVWECPDLLRIKDDQGYESWVLLVSLGGGPNGGSVTQYFVGNFDGNTFHSDQMNALWMDWGFDNYAGVTFANEPKNRANLMGWMNNWDYAGALPTGEFKGQMTLPRVLSLVPVDGHLRLKSDVVEEFGQLRNPDQLHQLEGMQDIPPNAVLKISDGMPFSTPLMEINLAFNMHEIKGVSSIAICFLNSLQQELCVGYDHERPADKVIFLNRELTGNLGAISGNFRGRATAGRETGDQVITFKIILDVAAVELFVDGGLTVLTSLFYPDEPLTRIEIRHHAGDEGSRLTLISGSVRGLNSIYDC